MRIGTEDQGRDGRVAVKEVVPKKEPAALRGAGIWGKLCLKTDFRLEHMSHLGPGRKDVD